MRTQKNGARRPRFLARRYQARAVFNVALEGDDVLCLRTFLALSYSELNALAFGQGFEAGALDSAEVSEHVRAVFLLDKTKTFSFVEPLNGTGGSGHIDLLIIQKVMEARLGAGCAGSLAFTYEGQDEHYG